MLHTNVFLIQLLTFQSVVDKELGVQAWSKREVDSCLTFFSRNWFELSSDIDPRVKSSSSCTGPKSNHFSIGALCCITVSTGVVSSSPS